MPSYSAVNTVRRFLSLSWAMIKDDWNSTLLLGIASTLDAVATGNQSAGLYLANYFFVFVKALLYYLGYALTHCAYNQLHCDEDRVSKPHRPIASGACSIEEAKRLFYTGVIALLLTSISLGVSPYAILWVLDVVLGSELVHIGWWKNFYSALGFYLMLSASWIIGGQKPDMTFLTLLCPSSPATLHIFSLPMLVFLTVWVQDFRDIEADFQHGRITTPMVLGEKKARLIMLWLFVVAGPILVSMTLLSPVVTFFHVLAAIAMSAALVVLGVILLRSKSRETDNFVYHAYILWFGVLLVCRLVLKVF